MERFQWLAAIIAAHPGHHVVGRTRLQKTVKLLQRLGIPLDYDYKLHHYGPYSEDLQAGITLLESMGLVTERVANNSANVQYYILEASDFAFSFTAFPEFSHYRKPIEIMSETELTVLELAATYDAFKEMECTDDEAMERLKKKKGDKCNEGRAEKALELLVTLGLN